MQGPLFHTSLFKLPYVNCLPSNLSPWKAALAIELISSIVSSSKSIRRDEIPVSICVIQVVLLLNIVVTVCILSGRILNSNPKSIPQIIFIKSSTSHLTSWVAFI